MVSKNLHVLGIDPGGTTGWYNITVPRDCIFGNAQAIFVEHDWGEFTGPEAQQAIEIARLAREIQSLDYLTGPAIMCEAWDQDPTFHNTDSEPLSPVRIGAMLTLLKEQKLLGDSTLHFQSRALAFGTVTDERLKRWGLWVKGSDHVRAALRHALTGLRRARENPEFARELWLYLFRRVVYTRGNPEETGGISLKVSRYRLTSGYSVGRNLPARYLPPLPEICGE